MLLEAEAHRHQGGDCQLDLSDRFQRESGGEGGIGGTLARIWRSGGLSGVSKGFTAATPICCVLGRGGTKGG